MSTIFRIIRGIVAAPFVLLGQLFAEHEEHKAWWSRDKREDGLDDDSRG